MAKPIAKIIGGPGQGNINNLELELAKWAAKMETTEDMVEKECKDGFLILVLSQS